MTSIAEPLTAPRGPSWLRAVLLATLLALLALQTPAPWGLLWVAVPAVAGVALLAAWRFGWWSLLLPAALLGAAVAVTPPELSWAWWVPAAALTGAWMGLREERAPGSGERAWMLLPLLALAAALPWMPRYPAVVGRLEAELAAGDRQFVTLARSVGYEGERLAKLTKGLEDNAELRRRALPNVLPTMLFAWMVLLIVAGRALSARAARTLNWPGLTRARLRSWRLPDGALWVFLAGFALLLSGWTAWTPTAWTLLLNAGLGFCVQGIAVVESLLLARGVSPSIIVLSMLFVFTVATPVFVLSTAALGLSDVWLDFRRLEPRPDESND